ncbi:hypothetical protein [Chryseobacterium caseinilyticum]|uniref:Uncharacterized protein n=1 Tax=Chryseobacterium caseinilyticum TaxID=2771428 RepID=A0ABR8ZB51_9FLAO|nr:hypothetical protein [Chryseobacterium caseinilyticum]MBD8082517.1 hypothetical protein [Chryseobacterium caseinilyticum]
MFRVEFSKYSDIMNKIMDEQTTLEVHLSAEYSQNVPKKFSDITPEEWAEYDFENGTEYSLNYYRNNKPYCEVLIDSMTISLSYYNDINFLKKDLMTCFSREI